MLSQISRKNKTTIDDIVCPHIIMWDLNFDSDFRGIWVIQVNLLDILSISFFTYNCTGTGI